jgi:hypothetical protein
MIVPGGGLSQDGSRWISSRPGFLVHVSSRLFCGRFLTMLVRAHARLKFFADHAALTDRRAFKRFLAPLRKIEWVVYTKNPFAGPKQVLRYLSRYTHRVAISNRRLVSTDDNAIAFRWKDYRIDGPDRWKTMTLHPHEFIPDSSPTSCPKASTASAITACSPAAIVPPTSHAHASCSVLPRPSSNFKRRSPLPPMSRASCLALAPAAAAG